MREEHLEPQVVLTLPLLVGLDGTEKMSKSLGNAIGVQEPPSEIYGKLMSIPDRLMWSYFELLTDVPAAEIASMRKDVESGANPRDVKATLARTITAQFHSPEDAQRAEEDFRRAFSRHELPEQVPIHRVERDALDWGAAATLVQVRLSDSMRDARRKIAEGALSIHREGSPEAGGFEVVHDPNEKILAGLGAEGRVLRLGRRFLDVRPAESKNS